MIRKKQIQQLTEDQSLLASMLRNKEITAEKAKDFSRKNVLTMCVGYFNDIKIYSKTGKVKAKDLFILCCDGLYNYIPEDYFQVLLTKPGKGKLSDLAASLRESILPGKAEDNVSVLLVKFSKSIGFIRRDKNRYYSN